MIRSLFLGRSAAPTALSHWRTRPVLIAGGLTVRLKLAILVATALLLVSAPLAAAQTTDEFEATFRETFGRSNAPSGVGHIYGTLVTEVFTFTGATETGDPSCPTVTTGFSVFTFPDGSTITTAEEYLICFPGQARSAPGGLVSYGNPETTTGTFEIVEGTGSFVGVTGDGDITLKAAGDIIIIHYSGTVTFP
jgi:hypothetical protein